MSKSDTWEQDLLNLLFNNLAATLIGDGGGLQPSGAPGSLFVSLHTADPGELGDQTTSEAAYTGYARVAVARSGAGWTVAGSAVENAALVQWPQSASGPETLTHFGVGTSAGGAGKLLYKGLLGQELIVNPGIQPESIAGALDVTED